MHILLTVLYTFPWLQQGEFVKPFRALLVSDHFLYSHDLNIWFKGTLSLLGIKGLNNIDLCLKSTVGFSLKKFFFLIFFLLCSLGVKRGWWDKAVNEQIYGNLGGLCDPELNISWC